MGGALPSACRVGACLVGRLLHAPSVCPSVGSVIQRLNSIVALLYSGSVIQWFCRALGGVKKSFSALLGIFYGIRILRYLYLSKVFNSLLFR